MDNYLPELIMIDNNESNTVEPRFSVILAANFPLNSKFFSGYQKLILLSKITLNRGSTVFEFLRKNGF